MSLFGSSGIRGVVGEAMTPDLALAIGAAVGTMCARVVLAKDTRTSGDMMMSALSAGAMSAGAQVSWAGMVPTPTLARAARRYDAGLMVTASHNPPEYNGVKMWNPDGSAFGTSQMREVEGLIGTRASRSADWRSVGSADEHTGAAEEHMDAILGAVGGSEARLVLDCGCGATTVISPRLFRRMGCSVLGLNCQPDGHFPGRPSEPSEENLVDLRGAVLRKGADLGIAHDGDGDRMVAFDERGRFVDGDRLLALFTVLTGARDVVAPVDASMILDDLVQGEVVRTRVGDVYVSEALKASGAGFGGEPSGTFIFPREGYCPDGVFAAAYLLSMLQGRKLSEMVDSIPKYPVQRRSFSFAAEARTTVESRLAEEMSSFHCQELITVDGYRAQFAEGWILVRLSGTEPKVRITAEARQDRDLKALVDRAEEAVRRCLA